MLKRLKRDRRQGYSFIGHARRVIATKGIRRVAMSLGGTALVAAVAFARCSSSSITGPNSGNGTTQSSGGEVSTGPTNNGSLTEMWLPAATFGPIKLTVTVIPPYSPCTNQSILWSPDKQYTIMSGYTQSSTAGSLRTQFHLASWALGVTDPISLATTDAGWRKYAGTENYDTQQRVYSTGMEKYKEEWDMKILSYGPNDERHDEDDFFLHMVVKVPIPPDDATAFAFGYCKDTDYGWWKNDSHYRDDD